MKIKFLKFIAIITVIFSVIPFGAFAQTIVFVDSDTGKAITDISSSEKIYAEIEFTPEESGKANVIAVGYDRDGNVVSVPIIEPINTASGKKITYNTTTFKKGIANYIKLFVWGADNIKPILSKNGVIGTEYIKDSFEEKFNIPADNCESSPFPVPSNSEISLKNLISAKDGVDVSDKYFEVASEQVGDGTAKVEYIPDRSNWLNSLVKFTGDGVLKLTVQDYSFCVPTELYINVITPIERYSKVFENTEDYLYRIGNVNTVELSKLFNVADSDVPVANRKVTIENVQGDATGIFTESTEFINSTFKFSGNGVVKVTISDDFAQPEELLLEVVDAKNIIKAESISASNAVLLNDISGTFTVTNGKTLYGNGFTVTLPKDCTNNVGDGFTGYISIGTSQDGGSANGGNLDNVKITGPVYPEMYIYRDQAKITDPSDPDYGDGYRMRYFKNSIIIYGGNSSITNSYISGSRSAICIRGGNDVYIENTTISGGAYANVHVCSVNNLTLKDVTTVQTDVADSYGKGKYAHGLGIAVDTNVAKINIEGKLNQYNWLNESKWDEIVPSTYLSSFPDFFKTNTYNSYWHYLNGGSSTYVNMGFIFACNWNTAKINDIRSNEEKAVTPYGTCNATIAGVAGGIYSKINTGSGGNAITDALLLDPGYTSPGFSPVAPVLDFDISQNLTESDADDENDPYDAYCVYSGETIKVGITDTNKTLDLSKITVLKNGNPVEYTTIFNGEEVTNNSVTISPENGIDQLLTFKTTVTELGFNAEGNPVSGTKEYIWNIPITVATLSFPAPVWNMSSTTFDAITNGVYAYYGTSNGYGEAVQIYEGIKVDYYDKTGKLVNLDLSGTTTHPTGSNNVNSNAFTYTLSDGSKLTMKFVSGWKSGATTHQFTTYNNKVYLYPQSLDNDNYIRAKISNQAFDVKLSYTFTDPNGQSVSATMGWYSSTANNGSVPKVQWKTFDATNGKKPTTCLTGDTLITLADGSYKRIDEVTYDDELLVWDFYNGEYISVPAIIIDNHGYANNTVIKLIFDDSTEIKIINLHQFFDAEKNEFVNVDAESVADLVGRSFVKRDGNAYKTVKLSGYEISQEYIDAYGIISAEHYNILAEDFFTTDYPLELVNLMTYFNVGENMVYDERDMTEKISTYGVYTYQEFADVMSEEQFDALNVKYMKIPVAKGYYTYEFIVALVKAYLN